MLLAGFVAGPHFASAQTSCENVDISSGTPPTVVTVTADKAARVQCTYLTADLTLTLETGKKIGSSTTQRATGTENLEGAINVWTADLGRNNANDLVVANKGKLYSNHRGLTVFHTGDGQTTITHEGMITSTQDGIYAANRLAAGAGSIEIKTTAGSTIASQAKGIRVRQDGTGGVVITHAGTITSRIDGIHVGRVAGDPRPTKSRVTITLEAGSKITSSSGRGVWAHIDGGTTAEDITITHDGTIETSSTGILATNESRGNVKVTTGKDSSITAQDTRDGYAGINASVRGSNTKGMVTVIHQGTLKTGAEGIYVSNRVGSGTGDIKVETALGSAITSSGNDGIYARIFPGSGTGNIEITHNGTITAKNGGILASNKGNGSVTVTTGKDSSITAQNTGESFAGINAFVGGNGSGTVEVTHEGKIESAAEGIYAFNEVSTGAGKIMVTTKKGSMITATRQGLWITHEGSGLFDVQIFGTVTGDSKYTSGTKYAGVLVGGRTGGDATKVRGGTILVGSQGYVGSKSKVAIQVDAYAGTDANPVTIVLEEDDVGLVGHVEGDILNPAKGSEDDTRSTLKFQTRSSSGTERVLTPDAADAIIHRRGEMKGVYDKVIRAHLKTITGGYKFEDDTSAPDLRLYSHRARLYEVLPSVLLGLVELTPYSTRMAVPRRSIGDEEVMVQSSKGEHVAVPGSRTGVWVRLAVRDGERMADTSTTARDFWRQSLAWDVKQTDFEAGLEVPTDDRLVLGVSAHYRQSEATVKRGGTMEASGTGVGVSLTWTDDSGLYVDGQLSYTRFFDITMVSANSAVGSITSTGGGNGLTLGVEVGRRMSVGDMIVIPRGGLSWSAVDMDALDEPARIDGAGIVAPDKEQSVQGRVGVLAELGPVDADRRLYASLDLEHEFAPEHEVMAAATKLKTEVKPTWVRVGVGGAMPLGDTDAMMLAGDVFYTTAGSNSTDFGGGLSLTLRF